MKKLDLYVIRVILRPFFSTLFILIGMIWLLQSIRLIDLVINKNMAMLDFLLLSILLIPGMLIVLLPLSFFSGVYSGLKKMVLDSEMDAIFSAGISRLNLLKPLFFLAFIMTLATYFISFYAMPAGRLAFADLKDEISEKADTLQVEEGTFSKISKHITIYVKEIRNNQWLKNIIVYDNSKEDTPVTWTAEEGVLKMSEDDTPNLFLINGTRQEMGSENTSVLAFNSHQIDLSRKAHEKVERPKKSSERFVHELLDTSHLTSEKKINKYKSEFYKRILWPLAPIALMFIPLYLLFKPIKSRFGIARPSIYSIVLAVLFVASEMLFNSRISAGDSIFVYFAIILPIIVPFIILILLIKEDVRRV